MAESSVSRRHLLGVLGAAGFTAAMSACGSSVGGDDAEESTSHGGPVKVGLVIPQAGVYTPLGGDMKRAWDLWLERHGGKFGNYTVTTVTADEGETPQTGVPAVQKLLQSDQVDILVGIVNSATALGVKDMVAEAKKLLVVSNAGANAITGASRSPYIWRTSFTNSQVSAPLGTHLGGPGRTAYAVAPDYAAGAEASAGFINAFKAAGGTVVGEDKPAFGKTQDYQPVLSKIQASGAQMTYCFFAGAEAVTFVKQYAQFGLAAKIPLYGSGFLTEGGVLAAQADAAVGVQTSLHYTTELDNAANKEFRGAYQSKYNATPTVYAVQTWDAANVLNRALRVTSGLGGDALASAMGAVGTVDDSPRGPWRFTGQSPTQKFYLRKVEKQGSALVNAVVKDLGESSQAG
ncbi:ABC transporter substrate-binding protein [Virgisporangium aurantiacum]|uniref:ABC transporter substrate-binding protein n=1 Tax=Virgisporangium aurantiacum TaxID=175570 RepID=A0A8J3Z8N1_9ACTN|nr:ABC transporter substrate-binding protein [Virgisporangium aurantiacum]GIJ56960.1 ABC transporter substrate-binding protein [Virgisporangium aurantiacum]